MRNPLVLQPRPTPRLPHLDAVRGIAALVVVLHHAFLSLPSGLDLIASFNRVIGLSLVSLGRPAVVLFFVLSGFVLTRGLQARTTGIALFATRRIVRLMPTYWVATGLAFGAFCLMPRHTTEHMSDWFNAQWGPGLSMTDVLRHFTMLSSGGQYPLDHVAWSLTHELRLSILLPIFVLLSRRVSFVLCLSAAALISAGAEVYVASHPAAFPTGLNGFLFDAPGVGASFVLTARLVLYFAIGSGLAMHWHRVEEALSRRRQLFVPILIACIALLSIPIEIVMAIGAALLIAIVTSSRRAAACLRIAPLQWLGRVSYSLYLIHVPIMLSCGLLLEGLASTWAALAIAVGVSLLAAEMLYRSVEAPSIRWSQGLGKTPAKAADLAPEPLLAAA